MGRIHSIETFGAVDGPGIRFVVFLQGCSMRCQYCHNPDTWEFDGGREMSVEELVTQISKYRNYFGKEGGVTVSGGEPLVQIDFVAELFKTLKDQGINTCLDTSGVLFNRDPKILSKFDELIKYTDLVLLDIKHIDAEKHKILTAHSNKNILDFAKYLNDKNVKMWIRYVLVPTINEDEESLNNLRQFIDTLSNVEKIEILPYHTMGVSKYEKLGIKYPLEGVNTPTNDQIDIANKILKGEIKWEKSGIALKKVVGLMKLT